MAERTCPCGVAFHAASPRARYCSDKCRKRTKRSGSDVVVDLPAVKPPTTSEDERLGPIATVARRQLLDADCLDTYLGQTALALANRLDRGQFETGSAYSSLSKEFKVTMAEATRGHAQTAAQSYQDELAARRAKQA